MITISGKVIDPDGNPLVGALVTAVSKAEGTTLVRETSNSGSYAFAEIKPGYWTVSASKEGFKSSTPVSGQFSQDRPDLDIRMTPAVKVEGTLYRGESNKETRVPWGVVAATAAGQEAEMVRAGEDGRYRFLGLPPGQWTFVAMEENSRSAKKERLLELGTDKIDIDFELYRTQGTEDEKAGRRFFFGLLIGLGVLVMLYLALHLWLPQPILSSSTLPSLLRRASVTVNEADPEAPEQWSETSPIGSTVAEIETALTAFLDSSTTLSEADKQIYENSLHRLQQAIDQINRASVETDNGDTANSKATAATEIATLAELLEPRRATRIALWSQEPWSYLEVLLWGLAGVLVNQIIVTGGYLRWNRFYREGIWLHVAQLVTTPLIVLVTVLLLSLITVNVQAVGGSTINLNLKEPQIMVAVAFLLGSRPWNVWRFLQSTADTITKSKDGN